jgi:hypothetical protein
MANFPVYQIGEEAVKFRFQEPFGSDAANKKSAGVVPVGIYRGYNPNPQANYQLFVNTDGVSNDSVAVVETPQHYNLTIRNEQQLVLDFQGHTTFPVYVVLRATYSLTPHPFSGTTDAKLVTTQVTQPGDIKVCSVLGLGPFNVPIVDTTIGTNRDQITGLVTQTEFSERMKMAVAEFPTFANGTLTRTLVHNFGLTGISSIGGSKTLYQTDQGLVYVLAYMTGFGEFSDTSTDWGYMVMGDLTTNQFQLTQVNARQGSIQIAMAVMLFVGVQGVSGGGIPPAPQIFVLPLNTLLSPIEFGTHPVGVDSPPVIVSVFNTGTLPLTVSALNLASPFFKISDNVLVPPNAPIPAGGSGLVALKFNAAVPGTFNGTLAISSDDPDDPVLNVFLRGTGV